MNIAEQFNAILKPHTTALAGVAGTHSVLIRKHLHDIYEAVSDLGAPDFNDVWQYCSFACTAPVTNGEFVNILTVPKNEAWLVQNIQLSPPAAAVNVTVQTDGGQLRGVVSAAIGIPVMTIINDGIVWLPGEHIVFTATAACSGIVGVIRRQRPQAMRPVQDVGGISNEMYAGRSNTHRPERDNLDQRGVWVGSEGEIRHSEGLYRNDQSPQETMDNAEPYYQIDHRRDTSPDVLDPTIP